VRPAELLDRLREQPFRPFRLHLSDQSAVDVRQPRMAIVGMDRAVLPTRFKSDEDGRRIARDWRTIALADVVNISPLPSDRHKR
jgi:hypothetical protein